MEEKEIANAVPVAGDFTVELINQLLRNEAIAGADHLVEPGKLDKCLADGRGFQGLDKAGG